MLLPHLDSKSYVTISSTRVHIPHPLLCLTVHPSASLVVNA